ncbi:MAG: Putative type IIS restriction /modification enzyme, N-terminal half [Ktedonobacterales bacterium]|jgi:hypothetical protein|nr:MAG: Putative type IIS restriction /modification enzyme, N-terminal half [Ktedonobacterales bacterium]
MAVAVATSRMRACLKDFAFTALFIEELGWDNPPANTLSVVAGGETYILRHVAQKRGFSVLLCDPDPRGGIPDYSTRKQIESQVTKLAREHLIIFVDRERTRQIWQWVKRQPGKPIAVREQPYFAGQTGEALVQRLRDFAIDIADEETLTILDVARKVSGSFDVERTTKRFYDRFKTEHDAFLKRIEGIASDDQRAWYASLMLNRLMFTYFIQKKDFLDGDTNYLPNRLKLVRERHGDGQFDRFYREFLRRFFHEGLGQPRAERADDLAALIGDIPYVNGGLFEVHQIEAANPAIAIPDDAFARVFAFFDEYHWHLDTEHHDEKHSDKEINPDVLGYIFEKYINQKQMGAYYTKEDITGYIGRNTILPFLFDSAREKCKVAFAPDGEVWRLLRDDPDAYIYEAVRRGVDLDLPEDIAAGIGDVAQRSGWNRPAAASYALPTETWREYVARRTRCHELRAKLAAGEITSINDLITYNLDIERFARDVIERCEGVELLRAFWQALNSITILDPTCGSGAFLFAALTILEPLYTAALDRMRAFVADYDRLGDSRSAPDLRAILASVKQHPNPRYAILKTIIVNNLYGVDIMAEACEIAKLRLFLKLVAQVDDKANLEPLPDIDFNIRAGNTLVGFATLDAVRDAMMYGGPNGQLRMPYPEDEEILRRINEKADIAASKFKQFRDQQTTYGGEITHKDKADLRRSLDDLNAVLNGYLAREYGVDPNDLFAFEPWRASHQPFHWFVEFYGIVHSRGGFDVIIGNPPYVEYKNIQNQYSIKGFLTEKCGDLYSFVMERSTGLLSHDGAMGMIVPVSVVSTDGFDDLRACLIHPGRLSWNLSFAERPSKLFTGVEKRLTIWLMRNVRHGEGLQVSNYRRWFSEERDILFATITFASLSDDRTSVNSAIPKVATARETSILERLSKQKPLRSFFVPHSESVVYYTRKLRYFVQFLDFIPRITDSRGEKLQPSELKEVHLGSVLHRDLVLAILNSSLFFWFFCTYSDVRNVNRREIEAFPCTIDEIRPSLAKALQGLSIQVMKDFASNSKSLTNNYGKFGVLTIQTFQPRLSKPIIDEIDRVLARHYGFTEEELDFIINYDIKYRMGQEAAGEEE